MFFKRNIQIILLTASSTLLMCSCGNKSQVEQKGEAQKLSTVPVVQVQKLRLNRELTLPGELRAYQNVPVHAKVEGYIKWIGIDRGSIVKKGQKMITIFCPELNEKVKEGSAKLSAAKSSYRQAQAAEDSEESKLVEVQARLDADTLTYQRLAQAAKTPGAIAQNEVDLQQKATESDQARVEAVKQEVQAAHNLVIAEQHNVQAANEVLHALNDMEAYLTVTAPFDGVITERNVHVGSIVAVDASRTADTMPLVRIQQKDVLRLVVAVPEDSTSEIKLGEHIKFTVPAFIGKKFEGIVARPGFALDDATRTMPVELNVYNTTGELEPGMFADVFWQVTRPYDTLFVPASAVDSDLRGTFVIRVKDNVSERVKVQRGLTMGSLTEVSGQLNADDLVALKATNELKTGTHLIAKLANENDIKNAGKHSSAGDE